jgi:hypothetical protein
MQLTTTRIGSALVLLATLTTACSNPSAPTRPTSSPSMSSGGASAITDVAAEQEASKRPVTGTCTTTFGAPLSPPPVIRQVDTGTCQLAHLGRTAIYLVQDIDVVAGTQTSVELTLTAANGDVLRASNVGTHVQTGPTSSSFSSTLTITGGTGRFADASGQWHLEGTVDRATSTATFTIVDGWITYDASDRAAQ